MKTKRLRNKWRSGMGQSLLAVLCALSITPGDTVYGRATSQQGGSADQVGPPIPDDQLDSLVAPIALYPDPLLSQVLVASTYPLEIIQLQQWLQRHTDLKGDALVVAVENENWDPSIQAMAVLPDVVKRLAEDIKWTTDLGNAFLAQQSDVMDAVQRMRVKASAAGNLKSNEQMKVETRVVETKTVVVIQQTNPQIVYVPWYNPVVVYGPPVYRYPYPPIYYPPPGYYAAGVAIGFGVGVAVGYYYRGGWGYNCGWGRRTTININVNNRYISHYNKTNINVNRTNINNVNVNRNTGGTWQHNPQHRGAAPYPNKQLATTYRGTARGDSASTRQASARQQQGANNRPQANASNRGAATANRPGSNAGANSSNLGTSTANRTGSNAGARPNNADATSANRAGSKAAANSNLGTSTANRTGSNAGARPNNTDAASANRPGSNAGASASNTGANRNSSGNNIGNRQVPSSDASRNNSAFGGASSRASAQASSTRGASSMGASRTGGARSSGGGATRKS